MGIKISMRALFCKHKSSGLQFYILLLCWLYMAASYHGRLFCLTLRNRTGDVLNHQEMHVLMQLVLLRETEDRIKNGVDRTKNRGSQRQSA